MTEIHTEVSGDLYLQSVQTARDLQIELAAAEYGVR